MSTQLGRIKRPCCRDNGWWSSGVGKSDMAEFEVDFELGQQSLGLLLKVGYE